MFRKAYIVAGVMVLALAGCGNGAVSEEERETVVYEANEPDEPDEAEETGRVDSSEEEVASDESEDEDPEEEVQHPKDDYLYEYFSHDGSVMIEVDYTTHESRIRDGEEVIPVDIVTGFYGPYIEKYDVDGDGEDEYVIAECEGTGTGCSIYGLCIVEKTDDGINLTKYEGSYFSDIVREEVDYSIDSDTNAVTVRVENTSGTEEYTVELEREAALKEITFGNIVRIRLIDGGISMSLPTGYIFADSPVPDYDQALEISAPIYVDTNSAITLGNFTLAPDNGSKTP